MSIEKKRAEILRLIGKLGEKDHRRGAALRGRSSASGRGEQRRVRAAPRIAGEASASQQRLRRQRDRLEELRSHREQLETSAETKIAASLHGFEERLARIEALLQERSTTASAAPAEALPPPNQIIGGQLQEGLLSDLLQLVSSNDWSGIFVVGGGDDEISLHFCEGEIWHAVGPGVVGEDAVFALMARTEGPYRFNENDKAPVERTVESNTQFLILEGLRRIDEDGGALG